MEGLYAELKRRNVFRVAALYVVSAWLIAQIADVVIGLWGLPLEVGRAALIVLALGFPVALALAWAFEWTSSGIHRETAASESAAPDRAEGRRMDFVIIALLSVALLYFVVNHQWQEAPLDDSASIAVLPFDNRSPNADDAYFTDGIHDDLLTQLAKISALKVISRTSVMQYRGSTKGVPEIARELGVKAVLEGGVQRAGNRVRINLQLIDAATDGHLWAETYDRELSVENVFAIQSEIATSIADILHARLLPDEQQRIDTVPTRNLEAYDAYLLGRQRFASRDQDGLVAARGYLERAVALDPQYALAYTGLADVLALLADWEVDARQGLLEAAERAAEKALALDPQLGEAHTSLGVVRKLRGDPASEYVANLQRGVELAPGYADAHKWFANYLAESGRNDEALLQLQTAVELDPLSAIIRVNLAEVLERLGRNEESRAAIDRALEIDPGFPPAVWALRGVLTMDQVLARVSDAYKSGARDEWTLLQMLHNYVDLGDLARAGQWLEAIEGVAPDSVPVKIGRMRILQIQGSAAALRQSAEDLVALETAFLPMPTRVLLIQDLRAGNLAVARERYASKYPEFLADELPDMQKSMAYIDYAMLLLALGETTEPNRILGAALTFMQANPGLFLNQGISVVRALALQGNREEAVQKLRELVDDNWRTNWQFYLEQDPALDSLRNDPRFQAMLDEVRADVASQLAGVRKLEASGQIVLPPGQRQARIPPPGFGLFFARLSSASHASFIMDAPILHQH